jgi:hypothetical protein
MAKTKKSARGEKTGRLIGGYQVLGYTDDGVRILKPKGRPKNFTVKELKKAIASSRSKSAG